MSLTRRSLLASAFPQLMLSKKTAVAKPHILFIAADDQNTNLGCFGHPIVKTPNIDRIASMGTRFENAYCQFPLCGPSRTSLLSGLRPDSTKILANEIAIRDKRPDAITLPQLFRQNGYKAHRYGKMYHMNVPAGVGSNAFDDPESWDVAISPPGLEQKTPGTRYPIQTSRPPGWVSIAFPNDKQEQADDRVAEMTIAAFEKSPDKPIFVGMGLVRPHVPNVAPARFYDLYPIETIKAVMNPPGDRDDIPKASEIAINTRANDMGMDEGGRREAIRSYYASISYMDWQVGRVLSALDRLKILDKTAIIFWGDHGYHLGEHHRWHKRSLFEESARAPLIVSAPGYKGRGRPCRSLVEFVDIYPTVAGIAGLKPPPMAEGQSLQPLLDKPSRKFKSAAFTQMFVPEQNIEGRAIRTDRYRYIRWTGPFPDEELYDHETDPKEYTNLAKKPGHDTVLRQMRGILDAGWKAARAKV